jgi:hypothetical protein
MLDAKVLAAVFASLTAIATTMNGGSFEPDMAVEGVSSSGVDVNELSGSNSAFSTLEKLRSLFTSRPEPTNTIQAVIEVTDLEDEKINLRKSSVYISDLRKVNLGSRTMYSDQDIVFNGMKGDIAFNDPTFIQGTASSVTSSGVNISGSVNINQEINSTQIVIEEKGRSKISFSDVDARITYGNKSEQTLSSKEFNIDSFSGKKTVYLENNTVVLDGKVNSLSAGKFRYGG